MPGKVCSIATCNSNSQKVKDNAENIMFFSFPKNEEICNEWVKRCCRKDKFNVQYKRVCSKHFSLVDYEDQLKAFLSGTRPKVLKKTALPTLLLPNIKQEHFDLKEEILAEREKQKAMITELLNESNVGNNVVLATDNTNLGPTHFSTPENGAMYEIVDNTEEDQKSLDEKYHFHCIVPHCTSKGDDDVFFYHFPKDEERRKKWVHILKLKEKLKDHTRVCSLHFRKDDFNLPSDALTLKVKPRLYKSAVPSLNLSQFPVSNGEVSIKITENNEDGIDAVAQNGNSTINGHSEHWDTSYNTRNIPEDLASNFSDDLDSIPDFTPKLPAVANVVTTDSFKEMCRCCIINKGEINVFEAHFQNAPFSELINYCTTEEISLNENLPRSICNICMQLVVSSYTFIKTVKDAQVHIKELEQLFNNRSENNTNEIIMPNDNASAPEISIQTDDNILGKSPRRNGKCFKRKFRRLNSVYKELCDVLEENRKEIKRPEGIKDVKFDRGFLKILTSSKESKEYGRDILSSLVKSLPTENSEGTAVDDSQTTVEVHSLPSDVIETNLKKIVYAGYDNVEISYDNGQPQVSTIQKKVTELACFECSEFFTTETNLIKHSKETGHVIPARFKCKECKATFHLRRAYKVHLSGHRTDSKTICEICGITISSRNLGRHLKSHTTKGSHICQVCGKEFGNKNSYDIHVKYKHSEMDHSLCFICGQTFRSLGLLNKHLNDKHRDEDLANKSFSCTKCHKYFATETSLKLHRICTDEKKTLKRCPVCSKTFAGSGLLIHMRLVHQSNKSHPCPICPRTFRMAAHLKNHLLKHNGGMPYKCTYCSRTFRFKRYFDNHIRSHTEVTAYNCSYCDKTFSHILLMQRHQQSHVMSAKRKFFNEEKVEEPKHNYGLIEEEIGQYDDIFLDQDNDYSDSS